MYICDVYKSSLRFYCQRYFGIKEIHTFAKEYLLSWFPKHPSYQTFCIRLNMLSEAFKELVEIMIQSFKPKDYDSLISIVDSMPILTCKGKYSNRGRKPPETFSHKPFQKSGQPINTLSIRLKKS